MGCKLGLNNPDEDGGAYRGKGIAELIKNIRHQLEDGGYTNVDNSQRKPQIYLVYSEDTLKFLDPSTGIDINTMFEIDEMYSEISCGGFDALDGGWDMCCKDCPYLQKEATTDSE